MFASHLHGWRLPQLRQTPPDLRQLVVGQVPQPCRGDIHLGLELPAFGLGHRIAARAACASLCALCESADSWQWIGFGRVKAMNA